MAGFEQDRGRRAELGWDDWVRGADRARATTARYFRARPEEVAFTKNTGDGINLIAGAVAWRRGDEVVTVANEFPSLVLPWKRLARRGVRLRVVPAQGSYVDPGAIEEAITSRTRLVALSWVLYGTGQRFPIRDLTRAAHQKGAQVLVDAIQGAGALRPDFSGWGSDYLVCGGHKWLMAPFGVGTLIVRREHLPRLTPPAVGWWSREDPDDFSPGNDRLARSARRFEVGNLAYGTIAGWNQSLRLLLSLRGGEAQVLAHSDRLVEAALERGWSLVTPESRRERAGIVTLRVSRLSASARRLERRRIMVSVRGDGLRISPHFWNLRQELDEFIAVVGRSL